jgi:hypothetical protein
MVLIIHIFQRRRDRMVVEFTTTCAIVAYHHKSCEFEPCSFQQYFSYIMAFSFNGGGNQSSRRKQQTRRKSLDKLYHIMLYREQGSNSQLLW